MTPGDARRRFVDALVAIMATINPDGTPNLVPVVFVVADQQIISAVDHKPKSTRTLQRLPTSNEING